MSYYNLLSHLRRLALFCLPVLTFLSASWSLASSQNDGSLQRFPLTDAQVREALFAYSGNGRAPGSSASATRTIFKRPATIKELSCWYELVEVVESLTKQGKRVLIATDIDETILCPRFYYEQQRDEDDQEIGRVLRSQYFLCHDGIGSILAKFMASDLVDVIAITKRDRSQSRVLSSQLQAQKISFVDKKNPVFLSPERIKARGLVHLSKPNAYLNNVIMTEHDEKADYLFEFLAASPKTYDNLVFIDNKISNCQNVAHELPKKSSIEVNTFHYLGHKSSCPTRHSLGVIQMNEADEHEEDEADEGLSAAELDLR